MQKFIGIMVFYIFISYILFPIGFYYGIGKTFANAGNGFVVGSLLSIALWLGFGKKMI